MSVCPPGAALPYGGAAFHHLSSASSGLSNNSVHAIVQDSNGFVWVGTEDGLNRYDGVSFRSYYKRDLGLSTSYIVSLCADEDGNVWVGTDNGLTRYDYATDSFEAFAVSTPGGDTARGKVSCIRIDGEGVVWFSAGGEGLFRYDPSGGDLSHYFHGPDFPALPAGITTFFIDDEGGFWLSLYFAGLWYAEPGMKDLREVRCDRDLSGDFIAGVYREASGGNVYIASASLGLCRLDPSEGTLGTLAPIGAGDNPPGLFVDGGGAIWVPTHNGLWRYDPSDGSLDHLVHDGMDRFTLSDNTVNSFFVDRQGGMWAGTANCGVDYSAPLQKCFRRHQSADGSMLEGAMVRTIDEDERGRVYLATENRGILSFDPASGSLSALKALPGWTSALLCDGDYLWTSTVRGLVRYDTRTGSLRRYDWLDPDTRLKDNKIFCILRTSTSEILCGTTLGLLSLDESRGRFNSIPALDGVYVRDMTEDHDGNLYLTSFADGLFRYDLRSGKVTGHWSAEASGASRIPSNKLNSVFEDSTGAIWVSSYSFGFFRLDPSDGSIRLYNAENNAAVSSDMTFSLVGDRDGSLWISSNKGLMRLDPATGEIVTFTSRDGLLDDDFNISSGIRLADGTLLFGSRNGMISFRPKDLELGNAPAPVIFTDLRMGGRLMVPGQEGCPITENINECSKVVLGHRQNSISITFSMPTLVSPTGGTISCRLKGHEGGGMKTLSWTGKRRFVGWSGLPAGRYVLEVSSPAGIHPPLEICVRRHPLLSRVAIGIYVLLLALAFTLLAIYLKSREKRRAEQVTFKDKMAFFTNIIHEIKTPLTLIKTPLQHIMTVQGGGEDISEDLSLINDNALYMDRLVREMLDFVRVEQNGYTLQPRRMDLCAKVEEMAAGFSKSARDKNILLTSGSGDGPRVMVDADDAALTKILNNLLDNAVKYAQTYIHVAVSEEGGMATVSISNDGPVIPRSRRREIFKPFVQFSEEKAPYSQSFGVGLAFARSLARLHGGDLVLSPGEETQFVLSLPLSTLQEIPVAVETPEVEDAADDRPLVLVVEDNADLQGYLRRKLLEHYRVAVSSSAEKALEIVARGEVDLIVTDIALEGMSGIELCRQINADFEHSHIVVVMLSALSTPSVKVEALESGASFYIEKPFDLDYLLSSIKVLLDRRQALRTAFLDETQQDYSSFSLPGSDETFLRRLDAAIMDNIADANLSNDQICGALCVSRSTLIRKVKGLLGTTPNDYIRLKRLSVAARMLQTGSVRISEVCYSVGFNTPSYFAKCFKAQYGMLPNEYAREHNQSYN